MHSILPNNRTRIAFLWGAAEAAFFFIVPDVWLSRVALENRRTAWMCCIWAVLGALIGGVIMYRWASVDAVGAFAYLDGIPGISESLIAQARLLLERGFFTGLVQGSLTGVPYKIFAVLAGQAGFELWLFMLMTIPARLLRFVLVVAVTSYIVVPLLKRFSLQQQRRMHLGFWCIFYIGYFAVMGW